MMNTSVLYSAAKLVTGALLIGIAICVCLLSPVRAEEKICVAIIDHAIGAEQPEIQTTYCPNGATVQYERGFAGWEAPTPTPDHPRYCKWNGSGWTCPSGRHISCSATACTR